MNTLRIHAVASAAITLALLAGPSAATAAGTMAVPTHGHHGHHSQHYSSCATMHQDYPRGIAHPKHRVSKKSKHVWVRVHGERVKYRPSLISAKAYNAQSRARDRDRDLVACELRLG